MATKKTGSSKSKTALEISAGVLAAAAAAGAGYYFYGDRNAKKHRAAAKKWAKGMKADVLKEAKKAKNLDRKVIADIVDRATAVYQGVRSVDAKDLKAAASELKKNWREVEREISSTVKRGKAKAGGTTKKAAKKAAPAKKKAAKKSTAKRASR